MIFSPSLVSDRYVQLTKIWTQGARLGRGAAIPLDRTSTPVELDQIYSSVLSLTPGTVSAGLSPDHTRLLLHVLDLEDADDLVAQVKSRYEAPLLEIFECSPT